MVDPTGPDRVRLASAGGSALALLAVLAAAAIWGPDQARAEVQARAAASARLAPFHSCGELIRYARRHLPKGAPGSGEASPQRGAEGDTQQEAQGISSGPGPPDSSRTNVQEPGIDEPDVVKTDGNRIFAMGGGRLHAVEARENPPRLLSSVKLEGAGHQLLLYGTRLLVISEGVPSPAKVPETSVPVGGSGATILTQVDVTDPAALRVVSTQTVDGSHVAARLIGATARVVISASPRAEDPRGARLRSRAAGYLPSFALGTGRARGRRSRPVVDCRSVRHPSRYSGLDTLTVLTVDLERGLPAIDADAVMATADTVYASPSGLYAATQAIPDRGVAETTAIHRFDTSAPDRTEYAASGSVPGSLLNQFSLSEEKGVLRVASTQVPISVDPDPDRRSESYVTVLQEHAGKLAPIGQARGLGRGERIFGVRFIGDRGYVVTFRQVDPLYTLDLSDPTAPAVLGELKLLGYSAYLHPISPTLLLGVGQDATPEGRALGTQLSLFDVGDPRNPVALAQRPIGPASSSEAEYDHKAFLYWPPAQLAVLPVAFTSSNEQPLFAGALGFRVDPAAGIGEVGRITHSLGRFPEPISRSVVIGERLYTLSETGVKASDLGSLSEQAWVPFPPGAESRPCGRRPCPPDAPDAVE